jgi:hypothetical protein
MSLSLFTLHSLLSSQTLDDPSSGFFYLKKNIDLVSDAKLLLSILENNETAEKERERDEVKDTKRSRAK